MASEQRIDSLLRHLRSGNAAQQQHAAVALAHLARNDKEFCHAVAAAGGATDLLRLVRRSTPTRDLQAAAATVLAFISDYAQTSQGDVRSHLEAAVAANGGIAELVRWPNRGGNLGDQLVAAGLLRHIASLGPDRCATIAEAGGHRLLVRTLQCGRLESGMQPAVAAAHEAAAWGLCELATESSERAQAIAAAGGVQALQQCLDGSDGSSGPVPAAASALAMLTCALPDASVAAGAVPTLVRLLSSGSQPVQHAAAECLRNITSDGGRDVRDAVASTGCVPVLVSLLGGDGEPVAVSAAALLGNITSGAAAQLAAVEAGAAPLLVRLASSGSAEAQDVAAYALHCLIRTSDPSVSASVLAAGGAAALARLLQHSSEAATMTHAAHGLFFLSNGERDSRLTVAAAGAVPALVGALGSAHVDVQQAALAALSNLAIDPESCPAISAAGGIAALAGLRDSQDPDVRDTAAEALETLSKGMQLASSAPGEPAPPAAAPPAAPTGTPLLNEPAASGPLAPPAAAEAARPSAQPQRPPAPRVCAAPGCGATAGLRRCGGCGSVRYCSAACSKAHWRAHKADCRRLQAEQAAAAAAADAGAGQP